MHGRHSGAVPNSIYVICCNHAIRTASGAQKAAPPAPWRTPSCSPDLINSFTPSWAHHLSARPAPALQHSACRKPFLASIPIFFRRTYTLFARFAAGLQLAESRCHAREVAGAARGGTMVDWQQEMCYWDMVTPVWASNQEATPNEAGSFPCKVSICRLSTCSKYLRSMRKRKHLNKNDSVRLVRIANV